MTVPEPILRVEALEVQYDTAAGPARAVDQVSFSLRPGERLGLIGESGSGKTTMATALLRLTRAPGRIAGGKVWLGGRDIMTLSPQDLRAVRLRDIAMIPQGAMSSLNPVLRVKAQIADAVAAHEPGIGRVAMAARIAALMTRVGLDLSVAERFPHELSGGMKQRTVMAIATSLSPKVIVADEPTSALDVVVQRQVMQTLGRLQTGIGAAVVLIGHDMGLIAQFADTVGVMYAGRLVEIGPVAAMISAPRHPYTRLLIDSLPGIDVKRQLTGIAGLPPRLSDMPPGCAFGPRCPLVHAACTRSVPVLQPLGPDHSAACHLYPEASSLPPMVPKTKVAS